MRYRIDRNANGKYRIVRRQAWWPFWFSEYEQLGWGAYAERIFDTCDDASAFIAARQCDKEWAAKSRRWKRAACESPRAVPAVASVAERSNQ